MTRPPDRATIRRVYDRVGARQDSQAVYEDPALDRLVARGGFESAGAVLEIGCGTGRFAARLLADHLPADARYVGLELSPRMAELAQARLAPWAGRAEVRLTDGGLDDLAAHGAPFDRVVASYVFDLLSPADIAAGLAGAHAALAPGGRLCTAGLTTGAGPVSHAVAGLWRLVHALRPTLVGGCRPLRLAPRLDPARWRVIHDETAVAVGVPSEILVAEPR